MFLIKNQIYCFQQIYIQNLLILKPYGSKKMMRISFSETTFSTLETFFKFSPILTLFSSQKIIYFICFYYKTNIPGCSIAKTNILAQLCSSRYGQIKIWTLSFFGCRPPLNRSRPSKHMDFPNDRGGPPRFGGGPSLTPTKEKLPYGIGSLICN